jgi:HEAT repeat protein
MPAARVMHRTFCRIVFLSCVFALPAFSQSDQDKRIRDLLGPDSTARGAAKTEILNHPDPGLLPALLKILPASTGSNRDDLLEVLGAYNDPQKIPVFVAVIKRRPRGSGLQQINQQLAKLGAPAARALLDGCAGEDEDYGDSAGVTIASMHESGAPFLVEAVESNDDCRHRIGETGLRIQYGDAGTDSELRSDIGLAVDAVVDPDEKIRSAARHWFDSWKGKEDRIQFSGIVDALISAYRSGAPPETMAKITQMLSDPERPRVSEFMRSAVNAPNPEVQRFAKNYLTRFPPQPKPPPSGNKLKTSKAKIEYLQRLNDVPSQDPNAKIVLLLKDPDAEVRTQAVSVLGELNAANNPRQGRQTNPETVLPGLRLALKDSSPEVRSAAVEAIGKIRSFHDIPLLVPLLHDPIASVIMSAEKVIGDFRDPSTGAALRQLYADEKNSPEVREQAFMSLAGVCDPESIPTLLSRLDAPNHISFFAVDGLVCALTKRPDASAFHSLRNAFDHAQDPVVREFLVRAMGATGNPEALAVLEPITKSHNPSLAPRAAEALGLLADRRAIPLLAELLRDPDNNVRSSAAWSLTRFSDFSAPPELIAALADSDRGVRIQASSALIQSHDPKAIDALIAALPDPVAMDALGKSRIPRAFPALLAVLQDPANKTDQRAAAALALGELGDSHAVDPLIAVLNEDNFSLTENACSALGALKDKRAIEPLKQARARWTGGQRQHAQSVQSAIAQALSALGATDAVQAPR